MTNYKFPPISFLSKVPQDGTTFDKAQLLSTAQKLEDALNSFGAQCRVMQINQGPVFTRYEVVPCAGVRISKIINLADDIALNLAVNKIRIEPIAGKTAIGIDVPNSERRLVYLRTVLESEQFKSFPSKLAFALGIDICGNIVVDDIAAMPNLLISGTTGSGKSVCINTIITSILFKSTPDEVKFVMVDTKGTNLNYYNGIPHLLIPVIDSAERAISALDWAYRESITRFHAFAEVGAVDIKSYNAKGTCLMPQILIIIDDFSDLMAVRPKETEEALIRLTRVSRQAGIHIVISTQRPSSKIITSAVKANFPSRIAFSTVSAIDSRVILDDKGAEDLEGDGEMLFYTTGFYKPARIQGAYVSDNEIRNIAEFLRSQNKENDYKQADANVKSDEHDEFFDEAVDLVVSKDKASVSMLQRQFRIGYNRASKLMDELEAAKIVGPEDGSKPREVLIREYDIKRYKRN